MKSISVLITMLPHAVQEPTYAFSSDSGMDLYAALAENQHQVIPPHCSAVIPTGITVAVPPGYELQVRSRSGLAASQGAFVLNAPGTIDAGYRGEIGVILANLSRENLDITRGMRIAQLVLCPIVHCEWTHVPSLPPSDRNAGGFGHTGV